jgi:alkylated DNA repair protein (DNA oxidative demethylase)
VAQDPNAPQCAWGYGEGGGGAIEVRDARLHVIDVEFRNNAAASPGPDIAGGAIYALGSLDVTVVGSRFVGNTGSNGGAVGLMQSNGRFVNSVFEGNSATGVGMNSVDASCPGVGHPGQSGAGGSSGAISVDGSDDTDLLVCGSRFVANTARELAGALFRTANVSPRRTTIDHSLFDGNRARQGGALFISNSAPLEIVASTFSNNAGGRVRGRADRGRRQSRSSTAPFAGNEATQGVGGALYLRDLGRRQLDPQRDRSRTTARWPAAAISPRRIFGATELSDRQHGPSPNNLTQTAASTDAVLLQPGARRLRHPMAAQPRGRRARPISPCVDGIVFADPALGALADNGGPTPTLMAGRRQRLARRGPRLPRHRSARPAAQPGADARSERSSERSGGRAVRAPPAGRGARPTDSRRRVTLAAATTAHAIAPASVECGVDRVELAPGASVLPRFAAPIDALLREGVEAITASAPFRHMQTPGGFTMAVAMTNFGPLGWVTDKRGYRYATRDPVSGAPWPPMPAPFRALAVRAAAAAGFARFDPDACLINRYAPRARLSLHRDADERDYAQPIVSVSLGLPATFVFGGLKTRRSGPARAARARRRRRLGRARANALPRRAGAEGRRRSAARPAAHQPDVPQGRLRPRRRGPPPRTRGRPAVG